MAHKLVAAATALTIGASGALAGGIERTNQAVGILFEDGRYAEFTFGAVNPSVSGVSAPALGSAPSGDMAPSYLQFGAAFRDDINNNLSYALIFDQPFGADVAYPTGTAYFATGSTAKLRSSALTAFLKYTTANNLSVYGGLRAQSLAAQANVPFIPGGYTAAGARDYSGGFVVGAAWENPAIAARVALTYNSKVKHDLNTLESSGAIAPNRPSTTRVETPQSLSLDLQSGVAANTLVFGGIRWVDWSEFDITPADYNTITGGSLVSYDDDTITYTLGVARRINQNWAVSFRVNYEAQNGGFASNLGPTDGLLGAVLGVQYTQGNTEISGGISYVDIGDAQTQITGVSPASSFTGNSAIGAGVRVGYRF